MTIVTGLQVRRGFSQLGRPISNAITQTRSKDCQNQARSLSLYPWLNGCRSLGNLQDRIVARCLAFDVATLSELSLGTILVVRLHANPGEAFGLGQVGWRHVLRNTVTASVCASKAIRFSDIEPHMSHDP